MFSFEIKIVDGFKYLFIVKDCRKKENRINRWQREGGQKLRRKSPKSDQLSFQYFAKLRPGQTLCQSSLDTKQWPCSTTVFHAALRNLYSDDNSTISYRIKLKFGMITLKL